MWQVCMEKCNIMPVKLVGVVSPSRGSIDVLMYSVFILCVCLRRCHPDPRRSRRHSNI